MSFVARLLTLVGLGWGALDYNTLCRRQKALNLSLRIIGFVQQSRFYSME